MRTLWWVGIGEALTLLLLVGNRVTVDAPSLSQGVGPLHGLLYLVGIALVWTTTRAARPRVLALVPGIGTLLAAATAPTELGRDRAPG